MPAEAVQVIERAYASGVFGNGPQAERQQRLRELAARSDADSRASLAARTAEAAKAKDGNALVRIGMVHVTIGQTDQGVALIEQGIAKGGLKRPDDAKLRLGMAQLQAPKLKSRAAQTLRSVGGSDGTSDVARLWIVAGAGT